MLYREIIAVCSQIHTKHINTLCEQNVRFFYVKPDCTYSYHRALKELLLQEKGLSLRRLHIIRANLSESISFSVVMPLLHPLFRHIQYVCCRPFLYWPHQQHNLTALTSSSRRQITLTIQTSARSFKWNFFPRMF